jgi:hypothetical protein
VGVSETLLGSLCREMGCILARRAAIAAALVRCQEAGLVRRLQQEVATLARRQRELGAVADSLRHARGIDPLAVAFFRELTRRSRLV